MSRVARNYLNRQSQIANRKLSRCSAASWLAESELAAELWQRRRCPPLLECRRDSPESFGAGGKGIRTPDFQLAKLALYQLSYAPRLNNFRISIGNWRLQGKEMPDVDLAIVIRHCRCAAAKTELCVTVSSLSFGFFQFQSLHGISADDQLIHPRG